jgi:hypothetical protein
MAEESTCGWQYNPSGDPIYTCKGTGSSDSGYKTNFIPDMPDWLTGIASKDAYTDSDLEILKIWLTQKNLKADPTDFLMAAKNLKKTGSTGKSGTSSSSSSSSSSTSTKCEKPKPKCKPSVKPASGSGSGSTVKKCPECPKCPPPKDYIRKDDIPCWACKI